MQIRMPSKIEFAIQGLLGAFIVLMLLDFFEAINASACTDPGSGQNCYPWGVTEGPMEGGSWAYKSKIHYLITQGTGAAVLATAALAPFLAHSRRSGVIALAGISILGFAGFWLATA